MKKALTILFTEDANATPGGSARTSTRMLNRAYRGFDKGEDDGLR